MAKKSKAGSSTPVPRKRKSARAEPCEAPLPPSPPPPPPPPPPAPPPPPETASSLIDETVDALVRRVSAYARSTPAPMLLTPDLVPIDVDGRIIWLSLSDPIVRIGDRDVRVTLNLLYPEDQAALRGERVPKKDEPVPRNSEAAPKNSEAAPKNSEPARSKSKGAKSESEPAREKKQPAAKKNVRKKS